MANLVNGSVAAQVATMTPEELRARIAELEAKLQTGGGKLTVKRSEKGAVSVYGLGRFPVTLYAAQWDRLLAHGPTIAEFIKANGDTLAHK